MLSQVEAAEIGSNVKCSQRDALQQSA